MSAGDNRTLLDDAFSTAFALVDEPGRCDGIAAINTIRSVLGVDLETLRPEPSVEGYTTPGGYSCQAVM